MSPRSRTPPGRDMRVINTTIHLTYTIDFWRIYIYHTDLHFLSQRPEWEEHGIRRNPRTTTCQQTILQLILRPCIYVKPSPTFFFIPTGHLPFTLYPPQFPLSFFFPLRWDINLCIFMLWCVLISPPLLVLSQQTDYAWSLGIPALTTCLYAPMLTVCHLMVYRLICLLALFLPFCSGLRHAATRDEKGDIAKLQGRFLLLCVQVDTEICL